MEWLELQVVMAEEPRLDWQPPRQLQLWPALLEVFVPQFAFAL